MATVDLPDFFLQTDQDKLLLLKVTGSGEIILVESNVKKWKKHLCMENGKPVIYVKCKKAIYGTMNAALLAYKKLAKLFKEWGFTMNPYDPCVWNKTFTKYQVTTVFHIDNLLLSCKVSSMVTLLITKLQKEYGSKEPLSVTRDKFHEYLEMVLDFLQNNVCMLSQYDFIKKFWLAIPDCWKPGYETTAAPANLFKIDPDSPLLNNAKKDDYHTYSAKVLWCSQRTRPDLQLSIGFHCTRAKSPSEDDWHKLRHFLQYL